jgi:hypothetical protein
MFYLQLRNELWKLFGKKRTYIGFLMFLLAQNVIILIFRFTNGPRVSMMRTLEGNGYLAEQFISALTVATFILLPIAYILLPLYVSLIGGDLVAKEAEDGTLRMILSRPISRLRLLVLKWLAGVIFSLVLVLALGLFGGVFGSLWFPWKGLFVFKCVHRHGAGVHVLVLQHQTGGGNHTRALVRVRQLYHAEYSLLPRPAALVSHVSPECLAIYVRSTHSMVEDR